MFFINALVNSTADLLVSDTDLLVADYWL